MTLPHVELTGKNGVRLTQELFYEHNKPDAPFSMRDANDSEGNYVSRSGKKYRSVPFIFRGSVDEYDAAMKILGSWEHWQKLCGLKWFVEGNVNNNGVSGLATWREEMRLRDESRAKSILMEQADGGNVTAARYLHETSRKGKVGRPEKTKAKKAVSSVSSIGSIFKEIEKKGAQG